MKTLILMRHAKSSWDAGDLSDHERPLSDRGHEAALKMGGWLRRTGLAPEMLLCSSAVRIRQTLELMRPKLPTDMIVSERKRLYMALPREILTEIAQVPDKIGCLMVLGHNPGIGSLAHWLAGQGKDREMAQLADKFPTAAIAVLDFDLDSWSQVDREAGTLRHFVTPKGED